MCLARLTLGRDAYPRVTHLRAGNGNAEGLNSLCVDATAKEPIVGEIQDGEGHPEMMSSGKCGQQTIQATVRAKQEGNARVYNTASGAKRAEQGRYC